MALGTKTRGAVTVTRTYCTRALGRKRVVTDGPRDFEDADAGLACCGILVEKRGGVGANAGGRKKRAPAVDVVDPCSIHLLPQDLLVRILCGVHHSDLEQLMLVSKPFRDAALIAKRIHFAFSTPMCKPVFTRVVLGTHEDEDSDQVNDDGADDHVPNAPRRTRKCESKLGGKRIDSLAVALFAGESDGDSHGWASHHGSMLIDF